MQSEYMQTSLGQIHCCRWLPEGEPAGVLQLIHGVADYTARYEELARFFTARGYAVVGCDLPGHGGSVGPDDQFGYLTGGWMGAVRTVHRFYRQIRAEYPGIPYVMFGHSMGSFLLRTYLFTYHVELAGVVLSGTAWMPEPVVQGGLALCREESVRLGERAQSPMLLEAVFDSYNRKFKPAQTDYDWVCGRKEIVDAYAKDPRCTWKPSIQLCREMMEGLCMIQKRSNLERMQKQLPVYFFAGQQDPVGSCGNGVLKAVQAFKDAGMQDVLVELYPNMRHECHQERGREMVFRDLWKWMQEKTAEQGLERCRP